jgi:hypothetical protein
MRYHIEVSDDLKTWCRMGSDEGHPTLEIATNILRGATGRMSCGGARIMDSDGKQVIAVHAPKVQP